MRALPLSILLVLACSSEKKSDPTPEPAHGDGGAGTAKPDPKPKADYPPNSGLAAKDNDPAVVALAKAAITCKVDDKTLDYFCDGYSKWRDSALMKENKADKTLVNFIEDPDEKVRFIGAEKLDGIRSGYGADPVAAKRVLAAAQRETSPLVAEKLGNALGRVDLEKAKITADVKKLVTDHPLVGLRAGLISAAQFVNTDVMFDAVFPQTKNKDDKIRFAAIQSFWVGTPSAKEQDVCQMWLDSADDTKPEIAGESAYMCGLRSGCKPKWDGLLDKIEKKAKDGAVPHTQMASALEWLYKQKEATPPQQTRAIAVAKAIIENPKNAASARQRAIDVIGAIDKEAKAYLAKFKDDPDAGIKSTVKRILEK